MREKERLDMVRKYVEEPGEIKNPSVALAMKLVPREMFLSEPCIKDAYKDTSLPIGIGRTLQAPSLIARMLDLANPSPEKICLEIHSGTGYVCAVSSFLFRKVVGVESNIPLAERSRQTLAKLALSRVTIQDKAEELFDSIILSQPVEEIPEHLFKQIAPYGTLVFLLEIPNDAPCLMTVTRDEWKKKYIQAIYPIQSLEKILLSK